METVKLKDLVDIVGGQIMTRVKADNPNEEVLETRRVLVPKAIDNSGMIDVDAMPEEELKTEVDDKKMTHSGDIVMKLNSPYDCAMVTKESEGAIVPSFCAIIRVKDSVKSDRLIPEYLLAYLNTKLCRVQLDRQVQGAVMSILSVGKVKEINIPMPEISKQHAIGMGYLERQQKLKTLKRIMELEVMKNDALFRELEG